MKRSQNIFGGLPYLRKDFTPSSVIFVSFFCVAVQQKNKGKSKFSWTQVKHLLMMEWALLLVIIVSQPAIPFFWLSPLPPLTFLIVAEMKIVSFSNEKMFRRTCWNFYLFYKVTNQQNPYFCWVSIINLQILFKHSWHIV